MGNDRIAGSACSPLQRDAKHGLSQTYNMTPATHDSKSDWRPCNRLSDVLPASVSIVVSRTLLTCFNQGLMFGQARGRQGAYDESKMEMEMTMVTQMGYGAGGQVHVLWRARRFYPGKRYSIQMQNY